MQAHSELILGGQRSGKSRRAEMLACDWLAQSPDHKAVLIATAVGWDNEMTERIARHQQDRKTRVPRMLCVEEPLAIGKALRAYSQASTLIVVDCLTLWLTNLLMPYEESQMSETHGNSQNPQKISLYDQVSYEEVASLFIAVKAALGPVVLVSNEIGWGVIPMGRDTRSFVDALGRLNQEAAFACEQVILMAAGLPLVLKGSA